MTARDTTPASHHVELVGCWSAEDRARVLAEVTQGLWRYIAAHAAETPTAARVLADLSGLTPEALETLCHLHCVLSDEVRAFIESGLPALLRRPHPVAPPRQTLGHGPVRGPIAWGATTTARLRRGGSDAALYVTATPLRHYSTPETRLLARLLEGLARCCHVLGERGGDGAAPAWGATVTGLQDVVTRARSDPHLRTVDAGADVASDLAACRRSPRAPIRLLARAHERYQHLVERPAPAALVEALRERVLVPLDDDTLYEVWALLGATAVFEQAGWKLQTEQLVGRHGTPFIYRSVHERTTARLRFGHTPAHWRRHSRYRAVFERYGLAGATRRPDLIIELCQGRRRRSLLIEVKRTRDPGYSADSVYKVLGYLADFEAAFGDQEGTRGLLLLWDGVAGAAPASTVAAPLVLATHRDYGDALRQWLTG